MRRLAVAVAVLLPGWAAPAQALEACPGQAARAEVLLSGQGLLESVITDDRGRLFFTGPRGLMRLDARDAEPTLLAPVEAGGGLAFDADGMLLVGSGNTAANGAVGDYLGRASLLKVHPDTGETSVHATGLSMANGVVRAPTGEIYASNDIGRNIDRIAGGETQRGWAQVESGNGLTIDLAGRYLYAAQTFRPAAIARVDLRDPSKVTTFAAPSDPADLSAGLDGMVRDGGDRIFAAANGAGEIWRADPDGSLCLVTGGLPPFPEGPSAVTTGSRGGTFAPENLYVVTFGGQLIEIAGAAQPAPLLRLRTSRTCRSVTLTATAGGRPVAGVDVTLGGRARRTGARGRARFPLPHTPGLATASRLGYEDAAVRVRPSC